MKEKKAKNKVRILEFDLSATKLGDTLLNPLEILLKPEENFDQSPYELLKENKRRKRKQSRHQCGGLHYQQYKNLAL